MRSSEPIVEDLVQSMGNKKNGRKMVLIICNFFFFGIPGKEEVEDLLESADWAVSHVCDNCKSHLNFY